jgi:hypothetical protein
LKKKKEERKEARRCVLQFIGLPVVRETFAGRSGNGIGRMPISYDTLGFLIKRRRECGPVRWLCIPGCLRVLLRGRVNSFRLLIAAVGKERKKERYRGNKVRHARKLARSRIVEGTKRARQQLHISSRVFFG